MIDNCFAYRFSDWPGPNVKSPTAYYKCCNSDCRMRLCLHPDGSISHAPSNVGKNHSYECTEVHYMHLTDHREQLEEIKQFVETNSAVQVDPNYAH